MDKRAILTAFGGTLLLLGLAFVVGCKPLSVVLHAIPIRSAGFGLPGIISGLALFLFIYAMPAVLSVVAQRRPVLWSLAPYGILVVFALVDGLVFHGLNMAYLKVTPVIGIALSWAGSLAIGLLIRWGSRLILARKRRAGIVAATNRTDYWPPPPT